MNVSIEQVKSLALLVSGGFLNGNGQSAQFAENSFGRQNVNARGQDGGFKHGVFGAVEAQERA